MILAVANQKGGVGKTTVAINLSAALAKKGLRVLLVDVDPQANASSGVGLKASARESLYPVICKKLPARSAIKETPWGFHVIPSSVELAGSEVELSFLENKEYLLKEALSPVSSSYDILLLDCPPSLGVLTVNALCAAEGVIIPLQCEYYALEGVSLLIKTLRRVREVLNPGLFIFGVVLTMYDVRNRLSREVAEEARSYFRWTVFDTIIPRTVRLSEAPSHGLPITEYDPKGKATEAFLKLAEEVIARVQERDAFRKRTIGSSGRPF